jgi:hypothetical protein
MRALLEMKRQISWQEQDLNIRPQDLNQLVASQLELPRNWISRNHRKYRESTTALKQATGLTSGPSARRKKDLLKLNRDQLR